MKKGSDPKPPSKPKGDCSKNKKIDASQIQSKENSEKGSISSKTTNKNLPKSNRDISATLNMNLEMDKIGELCAILDRLNSTYGHKYSKPPPTRIESEIIFPSNKSTSLSSPAENNVDNASSKTIDENSVSQEEKQALRKAKKEAKKQGAAPLSSQCDLSQSEKRIVNNTEISAGSAKNSCSNESTNQSKSKADLKRERREKQEAQRAAKEAAAKTKSATQIQPKEEIKKESASSKPTVRKLLAKKKEDRHLPLLEHLSTRVEHPLISINSSSIHPAIRSVGVCMQSLTIDGCISRVVATLSAICSLVEDYQTPVSCDLSRDLICQLTANVAFLNACRPIPEPMNNAIRFVRREINEILPSCSEKEAKDKILEAIDVYIHQNITLASQAITHNALDFVEDGDVILTYGFSSLVFETVKKAVSAKDHITVVIVDDPAFPSGLNLVKNYLDLGIIVHYRILPDLQHVINKVTKVMIEAEAVVLNGAVIGPCGMAGLILLASSHAVPVIALAHTFKFSNIDLTDSLVVNELGDPSTLRNRPGCPKDSSLSDWRNSPSLNVVSLKYDVTPPTLINVLVTERSNFPTSVVPVIIKRNFADILGQD